MIYELNETNFEDNIKNGLKLVEFGASWCGFCQKQKPVLQELSDANIWIGEVDADKNPNLVKKYDISGFPTFILFKNGDAVAKFSGFHPKYELMNKLIRFLN